MLKPHIEVTADGSETFRDPVLGEAYHSNRGARGESLHVFIEAGFGHLMGRLEVQLLEVGFGSGLNAYLTAQAAGQRGIHVTYEAVERYPVDPDVALSLHYAEDPLFRALHHAPWDTKTSISDHFTLHKIESALEDCFFAAGTFDLIYFDAFAPDTQPELWSAEIFSRLADCLRPGGILVTYSSKGVVKANLRQAGFEVQRLPGALGKHHMIRAVKPM